MPRLSIRSLMGIVLAIAMAFAALREANDVWAGVVSLLTALTLGYSILAAVYLRGTGKAWWLGFALFAGGYLALSESRELVTTQLLRYIHAQVAPIRRSSASLGSLQSLRNSYLRRMTDIKRRTQSNNDPSLVLIAKSLAKVTAQINEIQLPPPPSPAVIRWRSAFPGAANAEAFYRVGHCILAATAGLLGAILACRLRTSGSNSDER